MNNNIEFEIGKIYSSSSDSTNFPQQTHYNPKAKKVDCGWELPPNSDFILLEYKFCDSVHNLKILFEGKIGWIYSTNLNFILSNL